VLIAAEGVSPIIGDRRAGQVPTRHRWAEGVTIRHRSAHAVQRNCDRSKQSRLIYDQTCALKRRRRKRNEDPDPAKRAVINGSRSEGCGDCSVQSNCLSVEPLETEFGRKGTQINQSSCNKDLRYALRPRALLQWKAASSRSPEARAGTGCESANFRFANADRH
jgi:indolepyruvate ferredoxin oxidoreductase